MATITEYKIFCLTEGKVVRGYTGGLLTPICSNNHSHIVVPETLVKIAELDEEALIRGDHCQITERQLAIPGILGPTGIDVDFKAAGELRNVSYQGSTGLVGDFLDAYVIPNFDQQGVIGHLIGTAQIGDNILHVNAETISNLNLLFRVALSNGVSRQELGQVIDINPNNLTITVSVPVNQIFIAGSVIQVAIQFIQQYPLTSQGTNIIETDVSIEEDAITRFVYTNNNSLSKTFNFFTNFCY